jgi:hypothetical protein
MNDAVSWNELLRLSDWEGRQQRYPQALRKAREALVWAERDYGAESYEVVATWEYVAKAASFNQDADTVEKAQTAVQRLMGKLVPRTTKGTLLQASSLLYQANAQFLTFGDDQAAQKLLAKALKLRETLSGPQHASTGYVLARSGQLYDLCGDPQKGMPLLERARRIFESALGPCHIDLAQLLEDLGNVYLRAAQEPIARLEDLGSGHLCEEPIARPLCKKALEALSAARQIREAFGNPEEYLYYLLLSEAVALRRLGRTSDTVVLEPRAKKTLPLA